MYKVILILKKGHFSETMENMKIVTIYDSNWTNELSKHMLPWDAHLATSQETIDNGGKTKRVLAHEICCNNRGDPCLRGFGLIGEEYNVLTI